MIRTALLTVLFTAGFGSAAEIATNGTGGGLWSDPATWHGGKVPTSTDDVVLRKFDAVSFDRNDDGKTTCRKLQIDPKGALVFKTGLGKLVFECAGGIEAYGPIKLDGTKNPGDSLELRLTGTTAETRTVKLQKGGGLALYGRDSKSDPPNVILSAIPLPADSKEEPAALIEADSGVSIDWRRATVNGIRLSAKKLDNTGAKPAERLNVLDCRFANGSRFRFEGCDTPVINRCRFASAGEKQLAEAAIFTTGCPLCDFRDNVFLGGYAYGIASTYGTDPVIVGNTVEKCGTGIQVGPVSNNAMVTKSVIRECNVGVMSNTNSGAVIEDVTIERGQYGLHLAASDITVRDMILKDMNPKGNAILLDSGIVKLLNCTVKPDQIRLGAGLAAVKSPPYPAVSLQYVVVSAPNVPAGSLVELRTADPAPPAGAADPNVRNSPAALTEGRTPVPKALAPLIVRGWALDGKGTVVPPPAYTVNVLGPAPNADAPRPVLRSVPYKPKDDAHRPNPADATPTVEAK